MTADYLWTLVVTETAVLLGAIGLVVLPLAVWDLVCRLRDDRRNKKKGDDHE